MVDPRWAPLLDGNPSIQSVIPFPREAFRGAAGLAKGAKWLAGLAPLKPDLAIDLQGLLRSALMGKFSRAARFVGLGDAREGARLFYEDLALVSEKQHAVDRYLQILALLGLPIPEQKSFPLPVGADLPGFEPPPDYILLHPFARGAGKSMSSPQIARFAREVSPHPVVLVGMGTVPDGLPESAFDMVNQTNLHQLIGLIRKAAVVVSVDSGPMHLAAALGRPLVSVHTWSAPAKVGPYSDSAWIFQRSEIRRQNLRIPSPPDDTPNAFSDDDAVRLAKWIEDGEWRLAQTPE